MANCIRETNENIRRVIIGQELTKPLKQLDKSCNFQEKLLEFELNKEEDFSEKRKIRNEILRLQAKQKRTRHHHQPWGIFKKNCEDCKQLFQPTGRREKLCQTCNKQRCENRTMFIRIKQLNN